MSDQHDRAGSVLADVAQNLGGIFRHMLPGVLVVVGAKLAHPSWFQRLNLQSWQHLAALCSSDDRGREHMVRIQSLRPTPGG